MKIIKFWLLDIWTRMMAEKDGYVPVVHLYGILPNGARAIILDSTVRPHCVLEPPDGTVVNSVALNTVKHMLKNCTNKPTKIKHVKKLYWGEKRDFVKVWGINPSVDIKEYERMAVKGGWISHESDIYFDQIYMKERGIRTCTWNIIRGDIKRGSQHYERSRNIFTIKKFIKVRLDLETQEPRLIESVFDIEGEHIDGVKSILTIYYSSGKKVYRLQNKRRSERGEAKLLERFSNAINKTHPDLIYQYYGNRFDWLQIIDAAMDHNIRLPIGIDGSTPSVTQYQTIMVRGRPTVDLFGFSRRVGSKRKTLYKVHEELVKDGLVPKRRYYEVNKNKMYELPWGEIDKHCLADIICCMDIGKYSLPFHMYLSQATGIPIDQAGIVSLSPNLESVMMRFAHARNELIPNKGEKPHTRGRLQGAQTFKPKEWFAERVVVLDFASQYPWIISKWNIDYATYVENPGGDLSKYHMVADTDNDTNYFFRKEPRGLFAVSTDFIINSIENAKKKFGASSFSAKYAGEVQALKVLGRGEYGYMKYKFSRWGTIYGARAVTAQARNEVRGSAIHVEQFYPKQLDPIYGDTDSIFIRCIDEDCFNEDFMSLLAEDISEAVGAEIAVDAFYNRIFFCEHSSADRLAKKKYIYLTREGKVDMAGFAGKRGDWAPIAGKVQWKIAEKLMRTPDVKKGAIDSVRYTNMILENMHGIPEKEFMFTIGVRGDPESWDVILPHRAVAGRNPQEFIEEDGRVQYIICNESAGRRIHGAGYRNILSHRALHPTELKSKSDIDYSWYRVAQIGTLANRVLEQFLHEYDIEEFIDTDLPDVDYVRI